MIVPEAAVPPPRQESDTGYGLMDELDDAIAAAAPNARSATAAASGAGGTASGSDGRQPCPECGEMIVVGAAKCRFCGAVFDPRLKVKANRKSISLGSSDDDNPNVWEWLLCILCGGIGCIVGIVYAVQGKPKGMKMVGISIVVAVISGAIRAAMHNNMR
jgi:predicted RNA-binding Zn-ribbon protein involved in translation (DUF1610 family)